MKKYITKQSSIKGAGKGLFTNASFKKGEVIGLAHVDGQPTKVIGKNHNHNEKTPTANNIKNGNKRYLIASRNLKPGEEITTNYRLQPELEQPEDFEKKKGGNMTPQKDGYRTYSPFKNLPYIDIESDTIDSDNIVYDLNLQADNGLSKFIGKNTGLHTLPGAKVIREIPVKRKGGGTRDLVPMPKPSKKGLASKTYSRSLEATNKLFALNPLFEVPKSRKRKIFDPNASFYEEGGQSYSDNYVEMDLTPEEIQVYREGGYIVEEAPSLPLMEGRTAYKRWAYGVNDKMAMEENGGFIELELDDKEIERYRKGGYVVEEIKYQDGGVTTVPTMEQSQTPVIAPMVAPDMMPTGDLVAPPVVTEPVIAAPVQQPPALVTTPIEQPKAPTKKEVDKVAMPKIEASGDTLAIQKKLVAAGYNIGTSGPSKNGVDGVMGNRTKMALDAFNSGIPASKLKTPVANTTPKKNQVVNKNLKAGYLPYLDKGEEVCVKGKGCSSNVSIKMANLVGGFADGDIWANDAWFNKSEVLNKGGDLIYETSERDTSKMPKVPKDVYSKLQVGDYVQLNRPNTNTSNKFAAEKKAGLENENIEHLGFVVGKDKDGTPLIWHGSETGKAFIQRLDAPITLNDHDKSTFTYQVASIVRSPALKNADLSGLQNTAYYSTIDTKQKLVPGKTATERQKQAASVINNNVKNIKNLGYSQEDANFVGQILVGGIMQNETQGGESYKRIPKQIAATVWKNVLGQGEFEGDEASIGYYQMKPTLNFVNKDGSLNPLGKKLEKLGVDPKDIGTFDIDAQTKAGTIILLDNYGKLKADKDFNVKTGLYKGKIPASYILAKSWQAGIDWQNRDKYQKFLNNLDIDYSDKALLNAVNTMSISGTKKTVNAEYAKVKAYQNQLNAKKLAADKKIRDERIRKNNIQRASINKGIQDSRKIGYAESTAIRNVPTGLKGNPDLRKLDLSKQSLAKKPATKTFWDDMTAQLNASKKAAAKKPVAKKVVAKKPVAKKPVAKATPLAQYLKSLNNPLFKKTSLFSKGGIVTELSEKEIEAYKKAGYTIEELD